jgi:rare lipoprotein A (peptidoglycan hydrolase)
VEGRIIDLSRKAARKLRMIEEGVVKVRLEILRRKRREKKGKD